MKNYFQKIVCAAQASLKFAAGVACLFANIFFTRAQDFKIYFPHNDAVLHEDYLGNAETLKSMDEFFNTVQFSSRDTLEIVSYSSPEGRVGYNKSLSVKRASALKNYISGKYPEIASRISVRSEAESWDDLRASVESDGAMPDEVRKLVLGIIDAGDDPDVKEKTLRAFPGFESLYEASFPTLRYARLHIGMAPKEIPELPEEDIVPDENIIVPPPVLDTLAVTPRQQDTIAIEPRHTETVVVPVAFEQDKIANTIIALKTNLLYDAVTALNFEVEVPIADRWSVMVEDVFPWWETGNKYCFQMWEMGIEGRFWFRRWNPVGTEKLRGFFAGVYGMSSKYDFQWDRDINYQGEYWSAGVSGGYCMPIGKHKKLHLEFSLAAGFLHTDYRHYMPTDEYDRLIRDKYKVGKVSYFGPTKAKISLVWPISFKFNKPKTKMK
ncbi:MAG: DUF3575 domain-containing protein [Bacteroidales bacterium]|nr:DUF3575 domain-containing protein [Bacteroidales bacterium]